MKAAGQLGLSLTHSCRLLGDSDLGDVAKVQQQRLDEAPSGGYMAVDFTKVKHEGARIEGVDRHYSHEGIIWGHRFLTSALVFPDGGDPYALAATAAPSQRLAAEDHPYLTAGEAMLSAVGDVLVSGYDVKGVLVDAEFTGKLSLRSLPHFPVGIIGRFSSRTKVRYQGEELSGKTLAERFPPGKARYYRRFRCYAKRFTVFLSDVGKLDLIAIWYPHKTGWRLSLLISTIQAGVQELIAAFKARWGLEVIHRTVKQNLAFAKCQCLALAAQLRHADWCLDALHHMRRRRQHDPALTWKEAQKLVAEEAKSAFVTELNAIAT